MQGLFTFTIMPSTQTFTSHSMHKLKIIKVSNITLVEHRSEYQIGVTLFLIGNATNKDDLLGGYLS